SCPCTTGTRRSARDGSRPSPGCSHSRVRAYASAVTAARRGRTTTRASTRTHSPPAPSSGSTSTSAAIPTSTLSAKHRPCWRGSKEEGCDHRAASLLAPGYAYQTGAHQAFAKAAGGGEPVEGFSFGLIEKGRSAFFFCPATSHPPKPHEDEPVGPCQGRLGH